MKEKEFPNKPAELMREAPEEKSKSVWDNNFLRKMSEITGLTGTALIVYSNPSEGSRIFPPRNLVPVP